MKKTLLTFFFTASIFITFSQSSTLINQLSAKEKKEGWVLLFDGKTTDGWHLYNKGNVRSAWVAANGELKCDPGVSNVERGDLVSDKEYENYDLIFDWKISKGGNSGVFINVIEREDIPTAWASGPEYQLLENTHPDYAVSPTKWSGSLYGFIRSEKSARTRPAGVWNQSRIKQVNGKVEFYLNGILTATQDFNSQEWKDAVAKSGFKSFPEFGKNAKGKLSLQDWSSGISFRNIKIKEL